MASQILRGSSRGGLESILLQGRLVALTLVPEAGGKIVELRHRLSNRNWLWRNPNLTLERPSREADFAAELDVGGWDEVALSIKPGEVRNGGQHIADIPDHGDLLTCDWNIDRLEAKPGSDLLCEMSARGKAAKYLFERRIRIPESQAIVEFDYRMLNDGDQAVPYYWCAHPLLAIEQGAVIHLDGDLPMRIEDAGTRALLAPDTGQRWPNLKLRDGTSIDLSRRYQLNGGGPPIPHKIFVRAPESGEARVASPNGEEIVFRSKADELPWLGLWINNGAWSGCGSAPYINLGLEPATTPYDCINEAIESDAVRWLQPGEEKRWSLEVELRT